MILIIMIKTKTSHKTGKAFKDMLLLLRIPLNVKRTAVGLGRLVQIISDLYENGKQ